MLEVEVSIRDASKNRSATQRFILKSAKGLDQVASWLKEQATTIQKAPAPDGVTVVD